MNEEEIRVRAAIAALPQCIETVQNVLRQGVYVEGPIAEITARMAVQYADALAKELRHRFTN